MSPSPVVLPLAAEACRAVLREQVAASEPLLRTAAPDTPMPTCGNWTLHHLRTYPGQTYHRSVATGVRNGKPSGEQVAPANGERIVDRYVQGAGVLLTVLEKADPARTTPAGEFSPTLLSMALAGPHGVGPVCLSWPEAQLIRELHEVRSSDDVPLFCGPGMAQEVRWFPIELDVELLPLEVVASVYRPGPAGPYGMDGCHG
ncbi:hypothetical protein [Streptomyces sp. NPDC006012]|uniref:hypothetical protein n=1 Tax=Streptomyces sp. NPDC006012 TaxID=3364739 RepID=UPI003685F035